MRILAVLTITAGMINKRDTTKLLHYFIIFNPKGNLICSKGLLIKIIGKLCLRLQDLSMNLKGKSWIMELGFFELLRFAFVRGRCYNKIYA